MILNGKLTIVSPYRLRPTASPSQSGAMSNNSSYDHAVFTGG